MSWPTQPCIHVHEGLCPDCQAAFEADPSAWQEYGDHPAGLARWAEVDVWLKERAELPPPEPTDCPF